MIRLIDAKKYYKGDQKVKALDGINLQINQDSEKTIVIVTHDKEVAGYCNQTYHLQDGRIQDEQTN